MQMATRKFLLLPAQSCSLFTKHTALQPLILTQCAHHIRSIRWSRYVCVCVCANWTDENPHKMEKKTTTVTRRRSIVLMPLMPSILQLASKMWRHWNFLIRFKKLHFKSVFSKFRYSNCFVENRKKWIFNSACINQLMVFKLQSAKSNWKLKFWPIERFFHISSYCEIHFGSIEWCHSIALILLAGNDLNEVEKMNLLSKRNEPNINDSYSEIRTLLNSIIFPK